MQILIFLQSILVQFLFIVLAHSSVGILTGYSIAKLFNLPKEDKKTLAIEAGIQNSGHKSLGLITTFLMVWEVWLSSQAGGVYSLILSGLSIAYFFRKKW